MTEFTWRERLADWISGGALTRARKSEEVMFKESEYAYFLLRTDQALYRKSFAALIAIKDATADGKSGTARMVNRMAREALE